MSVEGREDEEEREPRQMWFLAAAGWTIALFFAINVTAQLTEAARPGASRDLVNDTACELFAYSLLLFAMVRVYAPTTPMRVALGVRPVSPLHVVLAAVAGAGVAPAMAMLDELMAKRFPQSPEEVEALTKLLTAPTIGQRIALVVALVVASPIVEELFFRGILFNGVRKGRTIATATLATTVYYASMQLDPRTFFATLAFGGLLGWLRAQSGSVASSIAAHVAFQAVQVAPLVRTGDPSVDFVYPRSWTLGGALAALLALLAARALAARDDRALAANKEP